MKKEAYMRKLKDNRKLKRALCIATVILLTLALVGAVLADNIKRKRAEANSLGFEEKTYDLQVQKQSLLVEYANVEEYYLKSIADGSYMGIMFTELDETLYNDVFPMFLKRTDGARRSAPVIGFMALYEGNMPGDEDKITRPQFDIMVEAGWEYVLYWDGEGELEEYIPRMKEVFNSLGLKFPNVILFRSRTYSSSYDKYLKNQGIAHAIHHGEENLPIIDMNADSQIWRPGSIGWNTHGQANLLLNSVVGKGGVAFFEVNFSDTTGEFRFDASDVSRTAAFGRMLDVFENLIIEDDLEVMNLDLAKEGRHRYLNAREDVLKDIDKRKEEILVLINAIDTEINKIYKEYFGD